MKSQKEVWNSIAPEWNRFRNKPMLEVENFLKDKKGKVLDLGCGSGRHLVKSKRLEFYEVDFSDEMINFAKMNAERKDINAKFFVSDSHEIPFKDNFFDSAIYIAALHCIESGKLRRESIKELFRAMKKDSKALITVWSKNHVKLVEHPKESTVSWKKNSENLQRYYYLYDKQELKELLEEIGFMVKSIMEDNRNIIAIVEKPITS